MALQAIYIKLHRPYHFLVFFQAPFKPIILYQLAKLNPKVLARFIHPTLLPWYNYGIFKKRKNYVWTDKPIRDFVFAEDAAEAVVKLVNSKFVGTINIGSGKSNSVKKLTEIISKLQRLYRNLYRLYRNCTQYWSSPVGNSPLKGSEF